MGLLIGLFFASSATAQDRTATGWVSKIVSLQGEVLIKRLGDTRWLPVKLNETFAAGDQIRVGANSRAGVVLANDSVLRLDQNTTLMFVEIEEERTFLLKLIKGAANFFSRRPRSLKILTPFVNGVVEGTEFYLCVGDNEALIDLFEGRILAENVHGSILLSEEQGASASAGSAPTSRILVHPRDSVQWAMHYPFIMDTESFQGLPLFKDSKALLDEGKPSEAIDRLEQVDPNDRNASFFVFRAGLLLHVGRVEMAKSDLQTALKLAADNPDALALKSVIAVVQNRTDKAVELAERAVKRDPSSAMAYVALSYALQSGFNLPEALEAATTAVAISPNSGLAWARLAELQLSVGALKRGEKGAQKAVKLNPRMASAHTTLGYAHLTRIKIDEARKAFQTAIVLDSADPLPRLGLGLAKIRKGDLKGGRREIEIAAGLDPGSSLLRSYLGKAYYEEKRSPLDATQFDIAKTLDPRDPTPWLYDAIRKQTENRPIEALDDLQLSIERNDNRAVYRSRLLLDKDRASRGASLARIYEDLDFEQKALVESTKSLSIDPTNHSAHRFLSDAYTRIPQHQIAQVSELLQSQLLQPININPVQPRMAIKGLNALTGTGPGTAGFNEYGPLFERNRPRLTASGVIGNNDTHGGEAIVSGLAGRFSYSLGEYYYKSDGFRDNNDVKHDVFNAFTQAALTDTVNLQLEYRHRDTEQGDQRLFLDPEFTPSPERQHLEQDIGRFGLHLSPSPRNDLIASFIYSDRRERGSLELDGIFPIQSDTTDDRDGIEAEAQYIFNEKRYSVLIGGGLYRTDGDWQQTTTADFGEPLPGLPPMEPLATTEKDVFEVNGENAYVYTTITYPDFLVWTLGVGYETYENTRNDLGSDLERVNPKLGLRWQVAEWLQIRTAYYRNIKRLLAVDQTIEPTQVAGFNQFFDDINGSLTELLGVAADASLTDSLFGGFELRWRDLTQADERNEEVYRCYLYWTPLSRWSLNAEYRYERDLLDFDLKTTAVPLAIHYFRPSGFFGRAGATFVWQKEETSDDMTLRDDFTLIDAAVGYRLPKRWGLVTLAANNLLDEDFSYQDASFKTSDLYGVVRPFVPARTVMASVELTF
jgi:tetratricopeptide (TPR) repeat protein